MKSLTFSRRIAYRYLWARRGESFISIITVMSVVGVAVGVMVLTIVMSIMTGFEKELRDKILGANAHIVIRPLGGMLTRVPEFLAEVEKVPGVRSVTPFSYHQVLARTDKSSTGLLIRGITKESPTAKMLQDAVEQPESFDALFDEQTMNVPVAAGGTEEATLPGIIVGRELARTLGLHVGTTLSLLAPQVTSSPFGLVPTFRRFLVVGIYKTGLIEYEGGVAYLSLEEAQRFFRMGTRASGLDVMVTTLDQSSKVTTEITRALFEISERVVVQDWTEINRPLWEALRLEKRVYFIVLLLIIVMASFSIVSTLVMLVLEKRKDIAILKSLGATVGDIEWIFRIQGATIGGIGTISGLILGVLGCVALREYGFPLDERIFQMSSVPVHMDAQSFIVVGVSAFAICILATMYPARRAGSIDPIRNLRFE